MTVPRGTLLEVRLAGRITSELSRTADPFRGHLTSDLLLDGGTVPAGSPVLGQVTEARPSGRVKGRARIALQLRELEFRGRRHGIETDTAVFEARATTGRDAKKVAIGAGAGSVLGGIAGGKAGAAKGAAIGAAAGGVGVLVTKGAEVVLDAESLIHFTIREESVLQAHPGA